MASKRRNVFFADARGPDHDIGGLISSVTITNSVFYTIVGITIGHDSTTFYIQTDAGETLARDEHQVCPGRYLVQSDEPVKATTRPFYTRVMSSTAATRLHAFRQQVRERDQGCVVTKVRNEYADEDDWTAFEAAHVVPLACVRRWRSLNFARFITCPPPPPHQDDTINSVQNGLLMLSNYHQLFDTYHFSILPSAGYKFIWFKPRAPAPPDGRLDQQLLDDPRRPPDELLEWHFEQAVLCHVRGAGEPHHEHDFPPGSDMMGEILAGPNAAARMEAELFTRLGLEDTGADDGSDNEM